MVSKRNNFVSNVVETREYSRFDYGVSVCTSFDSRNTKSWEGLGEVYYKEGKFLASLKAFTRALDLDPTFNTYYLLGLTNRRLGMLTEAAENFEKSTKLAEEHGQLHFPSLKALSETFYFRAIHEYGRGAFGLACDYLLKTVTVLRQCIEARYHHSLFGFLATVLLSFIDLKLLEIGTACSPLKDLLKKIRVICGVDLEKESPVTKDMLLDLCVSSLKKAIALSQADKKREMFLPFYWYELSRTYHFRTLETSAKGLGKVVYPTLNTMCYECDNTRSICAPLLGMPLVFIYETKFGSLPACSY
ncbi:hypothetical protein BC829DRAFT_303339 [Chytridium lagenaria]|nr:hypothetical protein BC829DRAFT_303339 [Chytridium lagenaria]